MSWRQLQAIIWLRWRLSRNQFVRGGKVNAVLSILSIVVLVTGAIGASAGGVVGGFFAGLKAPAPILLLICDGVIFVFLIFWFTGLMVEIQRSESIDLPKLLHLPVTLSQVFVFNYVASHFSPGMLIALPAMLGFCAGLIVGAGPVMVLLLPLVLGFVFMMTAWTYCLRGWLSALMVNKRRRRTVIVWVTIVFVLLAQVPNAIFNSSIFRQQMKSAERSSRGHGKRGGVPNQGQNGLVLPERMLQGHLLFPPGWVGYGAMTLKEHHPWPALGATVATWLIGVLGLIRAYRMTLRFYQGADGAAERRPVQAQSSGPRGTLLVERHLPGLPEEAAALTLATFRSLTRAPELKMAFIMPVIMAIVLGATRITSLKRGPSGLPESWKGFVATAVAMMAAFCIAPMMSNIFGLDRNGFRALVLLPARRRHILLAKNLSVAPFAALIALVLLAAVKVLARLPWESFVVGLLQAGSAFLMFCLVGNLLSILVPYRLAAGTLQAKKPKPVVFLAVFALMLLMPVMAIPLSVPALLALLCSFFDWAPWLPVNLVASLALLAMTALIYRLLLPMQGRLLVRREQKILQEVTEEVE
jgi:ABC-2 type transport system permease protein